MLTSEQITDWQAFWAVEPFGPRREEFRAAVQIIAAAGPWRKKGAGALTPAQIFPELGEGRRRQTGEEMLAAARRIAALHGGAT